MKKEEKISCSWYARCPNRDVECYRCKWNSENQNGDYLLLETKDGSQIRLL